MEGEKLIPEIIFEDKDLLVINKPSGVISHGDGRQNVYTIADWVKDYCPEMMGIGEALITDDGTIIDRPGMVHRLDKDTTGVMVLAKSQPVFLGLKRFFKTRKMVKEYHAFTYGSMPSARGTIDTPIGRSRNDIRTFTTNNPRGIVRDAETEYSVAWTDDMYSFVRFYPTTGRTHQVRVHAKHIQHPIVGDPLYAKHKKEDVLGFQRAALHARRITIPYQIGEQTFCASYPKDFCRAFNSLGVDICRIISCVV